MKYETLEYSLEDHVVKLVYNRPEQKNAISRQMNEELHHAWQRFRDDDDAFVPDIGPVELRHVRDRASLDDAFTYTISAGPRG